MAKFRKKPLVIDAVQYIGIYTETIKHFLAETPHEVDMEKGIKIATLEGIMLAEPFDWIIRGVKGEVYSRKPHIFEATYEPVE